MTHENEYFRSLASQLQAYHNDKETQSLHILIANLSVNGHQIDAVYIAHGKITVIDFKDYSGTLKLSENGQWSIDTADSKTVFVSGGARMRNPFQQVRAYKYSLLEFLNERKENFLDTNHDIDLGHISTFVNFQRPVEFNKEEIPRQAERWFRVTDVNSIIKALEDRNSSKLNFTDHEIEKLVECFGIDETMSFDPEENFDQPTQRRIDPTRLSVILRHMVDTSGWEPDKRLLQYYLSLVRSERYKASELKNNIIAQNIDYSSPDFTVKLDNYPDFFSAYIEDGASRWPKDVFVGLNVVIGTRLVPLFYKVIPRSTISNTYLIDINTESTELYVPSLEKMQLADDILETIQSKLTTLNSLSDKIDAIREELDTVIELSQSVTLALHQEGLYSAQLMSELRKLGSSNLSKDSLFYKILLNKPIGTNQVEGLPKPVLKVSQLNASQKRAVSLAFSQPITVITGPPGTGKSQVVLNIMANALYNDVKCLFVSRNHKAVDTVNDRFSQLIDSPYLIKFAGSGNIEEEVKPAITALTNRRQTLDENINSEFDKQDKLLKDFLSSYIQFKNIPNKIAEIENNIVKAKNRIVLAKEKLDNLGNDNENWDVLIDKENKLTYRDSELKSLQNHVRKYPSGIIGNLFQKSKKREIQSKLLRFRESLPHSIDEIVDKTAPLLLDDQGIKSSAKEFLNEINWLKTQQKDFELKISNAQNELDQVKTNYNQLTSELADLKNKLEQQSIEFKTFENKHLDQSKKVLDALIDKRILSADGDALISYRNFLPAKNAWQQNQIDELEKAQFGMIESLKLFSAVSLSVRNAFTLSPAIFDLVIVDEASQCDLASLLPVIYRAKRLVILGDPNQLPHITNITKPEADYVASKYDVGSFQVDFTSKSLFDYIDDLSKKSNFRSVMLNEHYRCHPEIIQWSNDNIYKLTLGQVMSVRTSPEQYDTKEKGFHWVNVLGDMDNESNTNQKQVESTVNLYNRLRKENPTCSIGIITPFTGQKKLLQETFGESDNMLKIDSVHKFQGDEKDIIIFNMVISTNAAKSKLDFVNKNSYILNVAITRARAALYVVGDFNALSSSGVAKTPIEKLANYANEISKVIK
ncbi:hypothetical protein AAT17_12585 [Nonlabens sp. MIC269]|nr:hypothetical protein AAT17_12585 [Nonlabens sp. MIC269]